MTKEEFESYYAGNSSMTVEELHSYGLYAMRCDCDEPECQGWAMDWEHRSERAAPGWRSMNTAGPLLEWERQVLAEREAESLSTPGELVVPPICPIQARIWFPDDTKRFVWLGCTFLAGHTPWLHSWQTPGEPGAFVLAPPASDVRNIEGGPRGYPYE